MKTWICKYCNNKMTRRGTIHFCKCGGVYFGIAEAWYHNEKGSGGTLK